MIIGKLIGALLGFLAFRWPGLLLGIFVGHYFDKGLSGLRAQQSAPADLPLAEHPFFSTVFTIAGHLAKSDGLISAAEVAGAERLIAEFGLDAAARSEAIALFKRGAAADFQLEPQVANFLQNAWLQPSLKSVLLEYLVTFALADQQIHAAERDILQRTARYLGFDAAQFARLLDMLEAQHRFQHRDYSQSAGQANAPDALADAYRALGVTAQASDGEVKTAYRKLMSQHHPDKLIAQGVPADMIRLATEKTQEIQAAYALIEKSRLK